ncbi:MAG TPA: nucleotidyltransferase domain-containing protein [Saprospiraceae bacterium]|nr:nucleotidyltransferase domain-containing protein [Saprospiraceae bacterium]
MILQRMLAAQEKLHVRIKAIYVFGSFCTKDFHKESDIDLGIQAHQPLTAIDKMELIRALDLPGGHVIDLIDLLAVDLEMQDIVISARNRIYTAPDACEEIEDYEHRVWVTYLTLCEDRKEIIEKIRKTGVVYGPDYIPKSRIRPLYKTR